MNRLPTLLLCALALGAGDDSYRYRIGGPAQPPETGIYRFSLSAEQLHNLGGAPERIRIRDHQGKIVPYMRRQVWIETQETRMVETKTRIDGISRPSRTVLEVRFHAVASDLIPQEMVIHTPMRDFKKNIELKGRDDDGQEWRPILQDGFIFDDAALKTGNRTLRLPEDCRCRRFLLRVSQATPEQLADLRRIGGGKDAAKSPEAPGSPPPPMVRHFQIDRIVFRTSVSRKTVRKPSWLTFAPPGQKPEWLPEERCTRWRLQPDFHPAAGIRFHCDDRNFSRKASLAAEGLPPVQGRIFSVELPGYRNSCTDLLFGDRKTSPRPVDVTVMHGDDPPLENLSLEWIVPEYEYVLLAGAQFFPLTVSSVAEPGKPQYGQEEVIQEAMGRLKPIDLRLDQGCGKVRSRIPVPQAPPPRPRRHWLLWLVLLAAVAAMGYGIAAALRKTDDLTASPRPKDG